MTQETAEIERDLAETRARLDDRLSALQDKIAPSQLANDTLSFFHGGDGADFTRDLLGRAKANPLPVALIGVGLAWLMASRHARGDVHARLGAAEQDVVRFSDEDDASYGNRLDDARGRVLGLSRDASDTAASYAQRIKDAVASAGQSVRGAVHDAQSGAAQGATTLRGRVAGLPAATRRSVTNAAGNPLALGAIAAAVGAVAGALLPTLDRERAALAPVGGKLKSAGRELAQEVVDRGGDVANQTLAALKDSAESHGLTTGKPIGEVVQGLTSGSLLGDVKTVAKDALQAGHESVQSHLASSEDATDGGDA